MHKIIRPWKEVSGVQSGVTKSKGVCDGAYLRGCSALKSNCLQMVDNSKNSKCGRFSSLINLIGFALLLGPSYWWVGMFEKKSGFFFTWCISAGINDNSLEIPDATQIVIR